MVGTITLMNAQYARHCVAQSRHITSPDLLGVAHRHLRSRWGFTVEASHTQCRSLPHLLAMTSTLWRTGKDKPCVTRLQTAMLRGSGPHWARAGTSEQVFGVDCLRALVCVHVMGFILP